jgi:hypothetical protein
MVLLLLLLLLLGGARAQGEPNPPTWPETVLVFRPSDPAATIESKVRAAYVDNGGREDHGQFSADRFAFLFTPGTYNVDVPVGYYTQVMGLGRSPSDVVFTGDKGVYCEEGDYDIDVGALQTFWRSAENFETRADHQWTDFKGMLWAVSQASPLRRIVVTENLKLYEYRGGGASGYASGGFMADSVVRGTVASGSQQQWLTRSTHVSKWVEGVWNMVFVGVPGAPQAHCGADLKNCNAPFTVVSNAPIVAEKPFISLEPALKPSCKTALLQLCAAARRASAGNCFVCAGAHQQQLQQAQCVQRELDSFCRTQDGHDPESDRYSLHIPQPRQNSTGAPVYNVNTPSESWQQTPSVDFTSVYVAASIKDTAATINARLARGLHVVLSPGVYELEDTLRLARHGQVLLGLGLATLIPTRGTAAVTVPGNVSGARVAGLLLEAGTMHSTTLLQWGDPTSARNITPPHLPDYGFMHDIFVRVGGPRMPAGMQASIDSMVRVDASGVVGDNLWLWRADHVQGGGLVRHGENPCDHALVVTGHDVIMYGLAAEHTLKEMVLWSGQRGATFFFQAELPYDVSTYPYAGYTVSPTVRSHNSYGAGVYHFFRDYEVTVQTGIKCPASLEASFVNPLAVYLDGKGTMLHIVNSHGAPTVKPNGPGATPAWLCAPPSSTAIASSAVIVGARSGGPRCAVGASVLCPNGGGAQCQGNQCCAAGGTTCPSAASNFHCCPNPKVVDCTNGTGPPVGPAPPPTPAPSPTPPPPGPPTPYPSMHCAVGATVPCPGSRSFCSGSQCCMDGSVCPSAIDTFHGCALGKKADCTIRPGTRADATDSQGTM